MSCRIKLPETARSLFSHIAIETGLSDEDLVLTSVGPYVHPKTFARLRIQPPPSVTAGQLTMIARCAEKHKLADAADVIAMVRHGDGQQLHPFYTAAVSQTFNHSLKVQLELSRRIQKFVLTAGYIRVFDRGDSVPYLLPPIEQENKAFVESPSPKGLSRWNSDPFQRHYDRCPRVSVVLTQNSITERVANGGDASIEHLIGNVECGEHSLNILGQTPRQDHRVFRGVFSDAQSICIFDRSAMLVLPNHQRSFRLYESTRNSRHAPLIADAIKQFRHIRRFRSHEPTRSGVVALLRKNLSYRLPGWH